jgi:hypothetical protein
MVTYSQNLQAELNDFLDDEFPEDQYSPRFQFRCRKLFNSAVEERAQQLLVERTKQRLGQVVSKRVNTANLMLERAAKIRKVL